MITQLHIKNFLLIEESVIQFDEGFNVITGESGSGKSLILKAIRFCLGQKVNKSFIGHWGAKAVVRMELQGDWPKDLLPELKSDSGQYIIHRVLREKSSQCFINDQKVSLANLSEIAPYLFLDCEQSQSIKLLNQDFQATIIDQKVNHNTLRAYFDARQEHQLLKARQQEIRSLLSKG
ncbi:MAG: AAA family ATPase, partial [Pseudomonadota bacterium]|nr:AAA family ATPase [Pseudomonadota bacterium]